MSQLYGLLAGLFVCLSAWAATTYVSEPAGMLVGLFLLTFFAVSTIYLTGDELIERQKTCTKALTDMEIIFFDKLKDIDRTISRLVVAADTSRHVGRGTESDVHALDAMIGRLDELLEAGRTAPLVTQCSTEKPIGQEARELSRIIVPQVTATFSPLACRASYLLPYKHLSSGRALPPHRLNHSPEPCLVSCMHTSGNQHLFLSLANRYELIAKSYFFV